MDLSTWDFERDGTVSLDGNWAMWYGQRLQPGTTDSGGSPLFVEVPGVWRGVESEDGPLPGTGFATYRLRVMLPPSMVGKDLALTLSNPRPTLLWVEGVEAAHWGDTSVEPSVPAGGHGKWQFRVDDTELEVVAQVANHHHRVGGLRRPLILGTPRQIELRNRLGLSLDVLMMVTLLVAGFFHIGVWILRPSEIAQAWFGGFCVVQSVRMGSDRIAYIVDVEGFQWLLALKVEYLSLYLSLIFATMMTQTLYPTKNTKRMQQLSFAMSAIGMLGVLLTPPSVYSHSLIIFNLFALICGIAVVYDLVRAVNAGQPRALLVTLCLFTFALCVLHDIARSQDWANLGFDLMYPGLLGFLVIQVYTLGRQYADSFTRVERLSENLLVTHQDLEETHRAVERFVPYEFLDLLERDSIREIKRGDHIRMQMGVLFCDLRGFTTTLEKMSPDEAFDFINRWLLCMEPAIHEHGGFINAYLGDAIMALFPGGADSAVAASISMIEGLELFNAEQEARGMPPVRVGIGIHLGKLMLGTIGGKDRIDCNVIGDAVNLASRLEGMTKMYGLIVIISESVAQALTTAPTTGDIPITRSLVPPDSNRRRPAPIVSLAPVELRTLDLVVAKGRTEPIAIYEVLDALPVMERAEKLGSRRAFDVAVLAYRSGDLQQALDAFEAMLLDHPTDLAAALYASRCRMYLRDGLPEGWAGITRLDRK